MESIQVRVCPICKSYNPGKVWNCYKCGATLSEKTIQQLTNQRPKYCPPYGHKNPGYARFCQVCGCHMPELPPPYETEVIKTAAGLQGGLAQAPIGSDVPDSAAQVPLGIRIEAGAFTLIGILILLFVVGATLFMGNQFYTALEPYTRIFGLSQVINGLQQGGNSSIVVEICVPIVALVTLSFGLFGLGSKLKQGSDVAKWIVIVLAAALIFLGRANGLIPALLLLAPIIYHWRWFEARKAQLNTHQASDLTSGDNL